MKKIDKDQLLQDIQVEVDRITETLKRMYAAEPTDEDWRKVLRDRQIEGFLGLRKGLEWAMHIARRRGLIDDEKL